MSIAGMVNCLALAVKNQNVVKLGFRLAFASLL